MAVIPRRPTRRKPWRVKGQARVWPELGHCACWPALQARSLSPLLRSKGLSSELISQERLARSTIIRQSRVGVRVMLSLVFCEALLAWSIHTLLAFETLPPQPSFSNASQGSPVLDPPHHQRPFSFQPSLPVSHPASRRSLHNHSIHASAVK